MEQAPALHLTCWGTRGSIPSPGPRTARFGGNTSCLELRSADGQRLVFDAGTGIRELGRRIDAGGTPAEVHLFLTHFHWDHIQGIPFFGPLYNPRAAIRIYAAKQENVDIQTLFAGQMAPIYFPVPFDAIAAGLEFIHLDEPTVEMNGGFQVAAMRVRHPAHTLGYRVRLGDASVAYIPDNDLGFGNEIPYEMPDGWYDRLVAFVGDADILVHDAMFTDEEYPDHTGWGHSTFSQAVRLAEDAGVGRLYFFHHAPERSDAELLRIAEGLSDQLARRNAGLEIALAAEQEEILVQERPS